jgi:uncharacterized peroxidase-related enzyme
MHAVPDRRRPRALRERRDRLWSDARITRREPESPEMTQTSQRFPVPAIDTLPEDIRTRLLAVQEKSGFVPNVFLTLAYRPDEFRAFFAYHDALMDKDGGLTKAEREMIVVATSSANQCQYCVIAHGAILRIRAKNPLIADQIAVNYRKADITPRQRAMLDFAMKVSMEAQGVSEQDFADLTHHGFSDDDAWDIAAISAFFALSNRMANVTAMRPNDEFYMMGRLPK